MCVPVPDPDVMKPKDLKFPHTWDERKPALHERVLFVPRHYQDHKQWKMPAWEDPLLFGKPGKVMIEFCSGNGAWVLDQAKKSGECWIAVEQKFERVRKIWSKMNNQAVSNLLVVCGEALTFSSNYLSPASVDEIFINFPDPWPKTKHAKNRLFRAPFIEELARILKRGGKVMAVTDHAPYCSEIILEMQKNSDFLPRYQAPHYVTDFPDYGTSYFDSLWRGKGKTIHYIGFERR